MSRPAPSSKTNFVQTALIMLVIFFGMQMFLGTKANQPQNAVFEGKALSTRADYLAALRKLNADGKEATAQTFVQQYDHAIDDAVSKKEISAEQAEAEKIEGGVLVADAFLKGGLIKDDSNKVRMAYQTLQAYERRDSKNSGWTKPVPITDKAFPGGFVSANGLYDHVVSTLGQRNKTDLVWGLIPGGYQLIDGLVNLTGAKPAFSYAFAAFLLALVVRAIVFPLSQKQLMFSRQMTQLTPRVTEIKQKFADNQAEQQKKVMELYKEYGINPFSGCLPALVQMPLFLTVYQCMLHYQFEFSKGQFLWINPNLSSATHGFFAANLGQQDAILILIYGITMTISTLLTPVTDPTQLKQQRLMGVGMSIMITIFMFLGIFPVVSGFVLYWTFTNLLATAQSLRAYRLPLPPLVKVNAPGGGVYPAGKPKGRWMQMMEEAQRVAEQQKKAPDTTQTISNGNGNGKLKIDNQTSNGKPAKNGAPEGSKPNGTAKHKPKKRG